MSIKRNAIANYVGQIYLTLSGILVVPLYIQHLGMEAYGLVGFFSILLTWLQLLDAGVSTTLMREAARYRANQAEFVWFPALFATLTRFFLISTLILVVLGWIATPWIAAHWLNAQHLPANDVVIAVGIMVITAAIRWRTSPYRSVIVGFEHQVWLNGVNLIITTLRTFGAVVVIQFFPNPVLTFFIWQLLVSIAEAACCIYKSCQLVPRSARKEKRDDLKGVLRPFIRFALSAAYSSAVWTFISQIDRLVLSKTLPLSQYGSFTVVATAATGILLLSSPIMQAIVPRMTGMKTRNEGDGEALKLYRYTTQAVAIFMAPLSITIACYAGPLLWAWTEKTQIVDEMSFVLSLYALGSGIQAICGLLYHLQYINGNLKLHMQGFSAFALILVPLNIWCALHYGALGTGWLWLGQNIFYLVGWAWLVHRRFAPGLHFTWLTRDVMLIWATSALIAWLSTFLPIDWNQNRWVNLLWLGLIGAINLGVCCLLHSLVIKRLRLPLFNVEERG
ncbi:MULTISPECIES: lipopolysaccharide biosynthesis protein [unclassified Pantoea]|jgi:O-antigen/teichoic acid export membrane protein|uniref:lipopolysaccharide biosynthesis protein n=1 Tax=unclassified Pantoea TaxID=2630326 RepID=UPI001CD619AB|nr:MULTISPECIES: oligosaccharide flippase family protein [unclassified Pantoea]MCA1175450.1 oligosaccharide flippase family protein [Pantoea sp. alder69]MCA1251427.1 oligosaccharide flippase family protein [Pantoea sp. alder70]MCA1263633.1 oligosaccharide flippase family protein [Pantoea sp. alder81]